MHVVMQNLFMELRACQKSSKLHKQKFELLTSRESSKVDDYTIGVCIHRSYSQVSDCTILTYNLCIEQLNN